MGRIDVLRDEITNDPLVRSYAGMTNQQVADSMNADDRSKVQVMSMTQVREWAAVDARALKIRNAITTGATDDIKNIALVADVMMGTDDGKLDPGNPLHVGMINALVGGGVLSSQDKTDLVDKARKSISRGEELGIGKVRLGNVQEARA